MALNAGGAAQGAQAGAAIAGPWGAAIGGLLGGASTVAASANAPKQSHSSNDPYTESWLDGSGWTVATGASSAKGGDRDQSSGETASPMMIAAGLVGLLVVVIALRGLKK